MRRKRRFGIVGIGRAVMMWRARRHRLIHVVNVKTDPFDNFVGTRSFVTLGFHDTANSSALAAIWPKVRHFPVDLHEDIAVDVQVGDHELVKFSLAKLTFVLQGLRKRRIFNFRA